MKLNLTPGQAQALLRLIRGTYDDGRDSWAIDAIAADLEREGIIITGDEDADDLHECASCGEKQTLDADTEETWQQWRCGACGAWNDKAEAAQPARFRPIMRACLDIPGDPAGGRIVIVSDYLKHRVHADWALWAEVFETLQRGETWRAPNGAWSLTPLKD